jgi:FMN phosphatase YigB (HAD superfamily)
MPDRWATFDCYGTLIDWERGIGDARPVLPGERSGGQVGTTHNRRS